MKSLVNLIVRVEFFTQLKEHLRFVPNQPSELSNDQKQGLDIPDIEAVVQYGIPRDVPTALQRGGRGGRNKTGQAVFLIMYESWVMDVDVSESAVTNLSASDPDHPIVAKLSKISNKQERTGIAMTKIIQSKECLRQMYAQYLGDETADGISLIF